MFSEPQTPGTLFEESPEAKFKFPGSANLRLSETSIIQAKLNRRLGPEYVSQRPAPGGGLKLTYVEGWKIIGLANEVFGYNGWNSTVTSLETDFVDMDPESRRWNVGVTAVVKITLKDGTHHEDVGYGTGDNLRSKGIALDKAKKEAVTDGVKRALRNFGNLLGLCYTKSHLRKSSTGIQDDSSTTLGHLAEDRKLIGSPSPQILSNHSKPSPLRRVTAATVPSPQQGPSSERNGTPVIPKADDSDLDSYFKDDNDAFLAVEDPNCGTGTTRKTELDCNVDRNVMKNDSSPSGARPQPAVASDQPVSPLRQAIRASISSLAAAGVKRPVEAMQCVICRMTDA
ncbi:Rad52/22 family double-strand break repair protein-domain-containing protein [Lactifluus volemus]|nr:Rad52/22 family double-strand break repair protein-domain-containing protein [Lactifluus volemus]